MLPDSATCDLAVFLRDIQLGPVHFSALKIVDPPAPPDEWVTMRWFQPVAKWGGMKQVVLLLTIINMMMTMNVTVWWRWWWYC